MTQLSYLEMNNYVSDLPDGVVEATSTQYGIWGDERAIRTLLTRVKPLAVNQTAYDQAQRDAHDLIVAQRLDWSCGVATPVTIAGDTAYEPADCYAKVNGWAITTCNALGVVYHTPPPA